MLLSFIFKAICDFKCENNGNIFKARQLIIVFGSPILSSKALIQNIEMDNESKQLGLLPPGSNVIHISSSSTKLNEETGKT